MCCLLSRVSCCVLFFALALFSLVSTAAAHEGPDALASWRLDERNTSDGMIKALRGLNATVVGHPQLSGSGAAQSLRFDGKSDYLLVAGDIRQARRILPKKLLTVSAWVAIDEPQQWGGIAGLIQDNGDHESGWLLGFRDNHFSFALATTGADDGNGKLTYLTGKTAFQTGRMYHVVGVYDGEQMSLFVNGRPDGQSSEQSGDIRYPAQGKFVLGAYLDNDERNLMRGRIRSISIYDAAATTKWVQHDFTHNSDLVTLPAKIVLDPIAMVVNPYLQYGTQTSMTIMWQTNRPASSTVRFGETAETLREQVGDPAATIHEVRLSGLEPGTQYFYRVESIDPQEGRISSPVRTFQTAGDDATPFAFAIISDTQGNPKVSGAMATMAWQQRPNFLIHPGDLVDTGTVAHHWTDHFFSSMDVLISRVPFYPVLGNHERDARFYYDYMSLPDPEYYYRFTYGNAAFFMIDSNRDVSPGSEQFRWLEKNLSACQKTWKFVCYHHPAYSSDENDFGDLWKTNKSTRGDLRVRQLTPLYDRYGVDIVWNGHIHSYERTWPLKENRAVNRGGTIYMITGGGGGSLETPGPIRPWFQNNVKRGHHYCMAFVNGKTLEFKAFDLEGRLFDYMKVEKP